MPNVWVLCTEPAHLAKSSLFSAHKNLKACKLLRPSCYFLSEFRTFASHSQWPGREEKRSELITAIQILWPQALFHRAVMPPVVSLIASTPSFVSVQNQLWWPCLVLSLWYLLQGRAQEHRPGHGAQSPDGTAITPHNPFSSHCHEHQETLPTQDPTAATLLLQHRSVISP